MARSFYGENKRVSNARVKSELGYAFQYPTYRKALDALYREGGSERLPNSPNSVDFS